MNIAFSVLFSLFSIGLGIFLIFSLGYLYFSSRNMEEWQIADGIITKSGIKRAGSTFSPDIQYQYFVLGTEYQGMNVTITLKQTYKLKIAQEWIAQYPVGARVKVFYNPTNYKIAVLEKGFSLKGALILLATSLFLIISGSFFLFLLYR